MGTTVVFVDVSILVALSSIVAAVIVANVVAVCLRGLGLVRLFMCSLLFTFVQ